MNLYLGEKFLLSTVGDSFCSFNILPQFLVRLENFILAYCLTFTNMASSSRQPAGGAPAQGYRPLEGKLGIVTGASRGTFPFLLYSSH